MFHSRICEATAGDGWVVAGNCSAHTADLLRPRAETMIWLDYGLPLLLRRVIARSWRRWRNDELLWGTNSERFWRHFYSPDSLLLYAITSQRRKRRQLGADMSDPRWTHLDWIHHRHPRETERWLATIGRDGE